MSRMMSMVMNPHDLRDRLESLGENDVRNRFLRSVYLGTRRTGELAYQQELIQVGWSFQRQHVHINTIAVAEEIGLNMWIAMEGSDSGQPVETIVWNGKAYQQEVSHLYETTPIENNDFYGENRGRKRQDVLKIQRYWEALWCLERYLGWGVDGALDGRWRVKNKPWTMSEGIDIGLNEALSELRDTAHFLMEMGQEMSLRPEFDFTKQVNEFWTLYQGVKVSFPDFNMDDFWKYVMYFPVGVNDWNLRVWRAIRESREKWVPLSLGEGISPKRQRKPRSI